MTVMHQKCILASASPRRRELLGLAGIAFAVAATLAVLSLKRVPEGQAYTIHRFGHYRRTLDAGLIDEVAARVRGLL